MMAFWFLIILAYKGPTQVGPFHDQAACLAAAAGVEKERYYHAICVPDRTVAK